MAATAEGRVKVGTVLALLALALTTAGMTAGLMGTVFQTRAEAAVHEGEDRATAARIDGKLDGLVTQMADHGAMLREIRDDMRAMGRR